MKKVFAGVLIGVLVLLGLTVFIQRKKIFNLCEDYFDDDEYECECDECCAPADVPRTEEVKAEEPKKEEKTSEEPVA